MAFRVGYPEMGMNLPCFRESFGMPMNVQSVAGEICHSNDMLCYQGHFTNHVGRIVNCPNCDEANIKYT